MAQLAAGSEQLGKEQHDKEISSFLGRLGSDCSKVKGIPHKDLHVRRPEIRVDVDESMELHPKYRYQYEVGWPRSSGSAGESGSEKH